MRCAAISRRQRRLGALLALAIAGALTSCSARRADPAVCEGGDGQISIAWPQRPGVDSYLVFRASDGVSSQLIGEVTGVSFVDTNVENGTRYRYMIRAVVPEGVEAPNRAACVAIPEAGDPSAVVAVTDLTCLEKSGKVDLAWTPIDGVSSYRVLRSGGGAGTSEVADVSDPIFVDLGLVNGSIYEYSVLAVDAGGHASPQSNAATCTPLASGEGEPPPVVAAPSCRGKNDKVDVTWTPVAGAAFYRVSRVQGSDAPVVVGEVSGNVLADFGLPLDVAQQYSVASVSATGATAAASEVCNVTPRGRSDGNHPPAFTSVPLTSAIEQHNWYMDLIAVDPDGDDVSFSVFVAPSGMRLSAPALATWIPGDDQIGTHVVELRATDTRGAYATQAFVVAVEAWNEPPTVTTVPPRSTQVGQIYRYDVDGFDPEGAPLRFAFASPAPAGASIDAATGELSWTPGSGDIGSRPLAVRVIDAEGASDTQNWSLDVWAGALELESPKGNFEVEVGSTLDLPLRANQPAARFAVFPLPANAGASADQARIRFAPTSPDAVGVYTVSVKARIGTTYDGETITVRVVNGNRPPQLAAPGPQSVDEGRELTVPITATDPDGDEVTLSVAGGLPPNALFDAIAGRLVFRPGFEQAGEYQIWFTATDGENSTTAAVPVLVNDREPPLAAVDLVVDPPATPTLRPTTRLSGNVRGDPTRPPDPEPFVAITGLSPASVRQGQLVNVTLTGLNTEFIAGQSVASFGDGISIESLDITSPTQAVARVRADATALLGNRTVRVAGSGPDATSVIAFRVEPGVTVFSGRLVDSFTHQPLANARVIVDGTAIEAETDAEGRFRVEGVAPGAQRIVIARNDYRVETLPLVFEANVDLALTEDVALDALARPFQPGGLLPRAASVASILDRGLGGGEEALTQEQAEALVEDTLIAVGGRLVGVLDESGAQLNPQLEGSGFLSFTRDGVASQARALLQGQRITLREIGTMLTAGFDWGASPPDPAALVAMLQRFADAAWAHPSDPLNVMAFVLLNEGTSLSSRPPAITQDTTLNRFQASLLTLAILLPSVEQLRQRADEQLRLLGLDPTTIGVRAPIPAIDPERSFAARIGGPLLHALATLMPATANAQGTGEVILGPNTNVEADTFAGQTFTRMKKYAWRSFSADLIVGNFISASIQTAIKGAIALAVGSTGGIAGTTLAISFIASMADGAAMSLMEKLALGYVIAAAADSIEPAPPLPERSFIDKPNDKLVIEFSRSASEIADETRGTNDLQRNLRQHSYELFEFKTPNSIDSRDASQIDAATLSVSQRDLNKLQFAIPLGLVASGVHYFRMATIQYLSAVQIPLDDARKKFSYEMQPGAEIGPTLIDDFKAPAKDWTNYVKGQYEIDEIQKIAIQEGVRNDLRSKYGTTTDSFSGLAQKHDVEIASLSKEKSALTSSIGSKRAAFDSSTKFEIDKVENLSRYANQEARKGNFDPAAFRNPSSEQAQKVTTALGYYRPNDTYRPEIGDNLAEMAEVRQGALRAEVHAGVHTEGITKLEQLKTDIQRGTVDPTSHGRSVETYDILGRPAEVPLDLPANRAAAAAQIDSAIHLEREKLGVSNQIVRDSEGRVGDIANRLKNQEVPSVRAHEADLADQIARGEELEKQLLNSKSQRNQALRDSRHFRQGQDQIKPTRTRETQFEFAKPKTQFLVGALNVVGGLAQIAGELNDIYDGTKLVYSDFSPPFRYTHSIRNVPPYSVEADPNIYMPDAIVIGRKGEHFINEQGQDVDESRTGWLRTSFFDTGENEDESEAGFPPEFLSVDSDGLIYAHNANSATRFGGRIFRYDPANGLAREFVGSVNYYSVLAQYGKPANPIAMTTGRVRFAGRPVETLFVADIEQVGTGGVALDRPKPTIKQLPIELLKPGEPYNDQSTRSHFVGQPFVEDPRFRFTGPTDMVALDDGTDTQRLYVSDEEKIFLVKHDLGTGAVAVQEILSTPGAQWSGLALDDAPQPNFYFADYRSGFVYWVKYADLMSAEVPGLSLYEFAKPLAALQRDGASIQVYDIDVHQGQRKLVGTSRRGVFSMSLPVIERNQSGDPALFVKRLGREYRGRLLQALNGAVYRVLPITEFEQANASVRVVARSGGADPAGSTTLEYDVQLPPAGPAEVEALP